MNCVTFHSMRCSRYTRWVTSASSPPAPCTLSVSTAMGQAGIFALPSKRARSIFWTVNG